MMTTLTGVFSTERSGSWRRKMRSTASPISIASVVIERVSFGGEVVEANVSFDINGGARKTVFDDGG